MNLSKRLLIAVHLKIEFYKENSDNPLTEIEIGEYVSIILPIPLFLIDCN